MFNYDRVRKVYKYLMQHLDSEICKTLLSVWEFANDADDINAASFDSSPVRDELIYVTNLLHGKLNDNLDLDIAEYIKICEMHPLKNYFMNNLELLVRATLDRANIPPDFTNASSYMSYKHVYLHGGHVYKISRSLVSEELGREIDVWANYPNEALVPVEFCTTISPKSGELFLCTVSSFISEPTTEAEIKQFFDSVSFGEYIKPSDECYEENVASDDAPYYLYDGFRIDDADESNFRKTNNMIFMIDFSEVDL